MSVCELVEMSRLEQSDKGGCGQRIKKVLSGGSLSDSDGERATRKSLPTVLYVGLEFKCASSKRSVMKGAKFGPERVAATQKKFRRQNKFALVATTTPDSNRFILSLPTH